MNETLLIASIKSGQVALTFFFNNIPADRTFKNGISEIHIYSVFGLYNIQCNTHTCCRFGIAKRIYLVIAYNGYTYFKIEIVFLHGCLNYSKTIVN